VAEEKGSAIGMSVKSVGAEGTTIEVSFVSEVQGFGRYTGGRNLGTLTALEGPNTSSNTGQGVMVTKDGEYLPWHTCGISRRVGDRVKGINLVAFSTHSQKYAWVNDVLLVLDTDSAADFSQISDTAYEWK